MELIYICACSWHLPVGYAVCVCVYIIFCVLFCIQLLKHPVQLFTPPLPLLIPSSILCNCFQKLLLDVYLQRLNELLVEHKTVVKVVCEMCMKRVCNSGLAKCLV